MKPPMQFYSQNFEDVFLWRCFRHLDVGFYVDVGAQYEEADSVTRLFYDIGWSGINIEPVREFAETFKRRTRDLTVCCAAGSCDAAMSMAVSLVSGLSSLDQGNAIKTESLGLLTETREVYVKTLNNIFLDYGLSHKSFEFLKVDVEGFELEVINGINLHQYRPRVILCEVTETNSSTKAPFFDQLCEAIEFYGYQKVYFDGLNQWWILADDFDELAQHFILPPGVMDSVLLTPYSGFAIRKQLDDAQDQLNQVELARQHLNQQISGLQCELYTLQAKYAKIRTFLEWLEVNFSLATKPFVSIRAIVWRANGYFFSKLVRLARRPRR